MVHRLSSLLSNNLFTYLVTLTSEQRTNPKWMESSVGRDPHDPRVTGSSCKNVTVNCVIVGQIRPALELPILNGRGKYHDAETEKG